MSCCFSVPEKKGSVEIMKERENSDLPVRGRLLMVALSTPQYFSLSRQRKSQSLKTCCASVKGVRCSSKPAPWRCCRGTELASTPPFESLK